MSFLSYHLLCLSLWSPIRLLLGPTTSTVFFVNSISVADALPFCYHAQFCSLFRLFAISYLEDSSILFFHVPLSLDSFLFIFSSSSVSNCCSLIILDSSRSDVFKYPSFLQLSALALFAISVEYGLVHVGTMGTSSVLGITLRDHFYCNLFRAGLSPASHPFDA